MNINPISLQTNSTAYKPSFKANILNYNQIYNKLEHSFLRVGDDRAHRISQLKGMKALIEKAGDKLTNILPVIERNEGGYPSWGRKTYYKIDVTNDRFPNMKYTEHLDMYSGALDVSGLNEMMLDKLTEQYVDKSSPVAEKTTKESIKKLETRFLAKISLAAGKMPQEVLKMFGVISPYWNGIAEAASKTELKIDPKTLVQEQQEFKKNFELFLNSRKKVSNG